MHLFYPLSKRLLIKYLMACIVNEYKFLKMDSNFVLFFIGPSISYMRNQVIPF